MIKSKVKTLSKKVEVAISSNDKTTALSALKEATVAIDQACSKGVFHKNTAARKVSRLTKAVNGSFFYNNIYFRRKTTANTYIKILIFFSFALPVIRLITT